MDFMKTMNEFKCEAPSGGSQAVTGATGSQKYFTFQLGEENYGLDILSVQEIIGLIDITPVPMTPHYVRGVITLRGKIIPVIDLRQKFGMGPTADHPRKCIVVIDFRKEDGNKIPMSILVDQVSEVLDIAVTDIESSPYLGSNSSASMDYIQGVAKVKGHIKILLNLKAIISPNSIAVTQNISEQEME
jgi:purine-binding chemotaxis protein CheW